MALGFAIVISFAFYLPFAKYWLQINPFAPSIMMFLAMALSVDYSMFLLSRFAAEIRKKAVKQMLAYSGHVVLLSGVVLMVSYFGLVFFPVAGMNTSGYGAVIAIACCIVINISLTASCILQFPVFYGNLEIIPFFIVQCLYYGCRCHHRPRQKGSDAGLFRREKEEELVVGKTETNAEEAEEQEEEARRLNRAQETALHYKLYCCQQIPCKAKCCLLLFDYTRLTQGNSTQNEQLLGHDGVVNDNKHGSTSFLVKSEDVYGKEIEKDDSMSEDNDHADSAFSGNFSPESTKDPQYLSLSTRNQSGVKIISDLTVQDTSHFFLIGWVHLLSGSKE
ncbi:hypothetical protein RFI_13414 [Reticulomyxa filosa]|uniref:Membrane transport protein MMPL domain-containing protein n=1 Tax=Reticulomyxa filosa TaxID=46433 RepID=X6NCZ2_RETFI|nr:hypothetical protein RFI_13414 [Reticulomyxa filosa]|eukprot:ETO23763.1 hypothetical protein RFI_13414 [Reticulomyxa filosa]